MMIRLWLILTLLILQATALIGGTVALARRDPQYTCLSFNNITVQLDTSLFVRSTFPTNISLSSPDQQHQVYVEMQTRLAGTKNATLNPFIPPIGYGIVLQSRDERRVLRHHLPYNPPAFFWSPDSAYLIYTWAGKDNQTLISLTDSVGNDLLTAPVSFYVLYFLGWIADSHYFLFVSYNGEATHLFVIDSHTHEINKLNIPDPYPFKNRKLVDKHQVYFTSTTQFYSIDLDRLIYSTTPLPAKLDPLLEGVWSPDYHYLYQADYYNDGYEVQIFERENETLRWIAAIPPWSPANTGTPIWSTDSQSLTYFEAAANGWKTHVFHIPTQQDTVIDENGVRSEIQRGRMFIYSNEGGIHIVKLMDIDGKNAVTIVRTFNYVDIRWQENSTYLSVVEEGQNFITVHWIGLYEESAHHLQSGENLVIPDDMPAFVRNLLPSSTLPMPGNQFVFSLPNSDQLLIHLSDGSKIELYRFDPATQQSILIDSATPPSDILILGNLILSPDKKYVAFMTRHSNHFSLYVIQLDRHEQYYLGDFPGTADRLTWTRCDY